MTAIGDAIARDGNTCIGIKFDLISAGFVTSTARACELSLIELRTFRFMVDEVPKRPT